MNTTTNKIVLVTGATGQQGGSVTTALLNRGFSVRALTRNTSSDSALALVERGVEVVRGDTSVITNSSSLRHQAWTACFS